MSIKGTLNVISVTWPSIDRVASTVYNAIPLKAFSV